MTALDIQLRSSVLIARAQAAISIFERHGKRFSADLTRQFVTALECDHPPALYEHWISEQCERARQIEAAAFARGEVPSPELIALADARYEENRRG